MPPSCSRPASPRSAPRVGRCSRRSAGSRRAPACGCSVPTARASSTSRGVRSRASRTRRRRSTASQVGPVAYVGQSGAVGGAMFDLLRERGLTPAVWVSTGQPGRRRRHRGGAATSCAIPRSTSILVYVEQTPDGSAWDARRSCRRGRWEATRGAARRRDRGGTARPCRRTPARWSASGERSSSRREANGVLLVDDLEPMIDLALARHGGAHRSGRRVGDHQHVGRSREPRGRLVRAQRARGAEAVAGDARRQSSSCSRPFASSVNPIDVTATFMMGRVRAGWGSCAPSCRTTATSITTLLVLTNTVGAVAMELARSIAVGT